MSLLQPADEDVEEEVRPDEESSPPPQLFQQLYVTCPDGLAVTYFLESSVGEYSFTKTYFIWNSIL